MVTANQFEPLIGFICGAAVMISFHNLFVSIVLYKARKSNVSNINKIILNLSVMILFLFRFSIGFTPTRVDLPVASYPVRDYCWVDQSKFKIPEVIAIVTDFSIDIYITVRLVQILLKANKNTAGLRVNVGREKKRTLFTAVMYWNFVRLAVAFGINLMAVLNLLPLTSEFGQYFVKLFFNTFFFVLMSYVVTVDAEIVKVIEGENQNKKRSSKSTNENSSYPSSPTNRATYKSAALLPKNNTSSSPQSDYNVSVKRLSFFEWTNLVLSFGSGKNHTQEFTQEEFEEIIEGSSEATERDPEKGEATNDPNRSSNISEGSTIIIQNTETTNVSKIVQ
ncbi:7757_t:CDS:2 [Diversispora eburnea]|uniref:7757_t:CDS:1 n=1 Tax=Diversispora eburnea TaxID=1213867 RepID=A0A9N8ZYV4_9GLOM|nr:7757_t:CDS:2 [Diversispora eburnea]